MYRAEVVTVARQVPLLSGEIIARSRNGSPIGLLVELDPDNLRSPDCRTTLGGREVQSVNMSNMRCKDVDV